MQQSCTYGSVRGALGNRRPYRDRKPVIKDFFLRVLSFESYFPILNHVAGQRFAANRVSSRDHS